MQLVGLRHKSFIVRIYCGGELQTHRGVIKFDDIIGKPWGTKISSHLGKPFYVLQPPLGDLLKELPRPSQIMYPKDLGFLLINLGIGEPDFETPSYIKTAAIKAIQDGFTHYTATSGISELKEAIVNKFKIDNQIRYQTDQIIVGSGSKPLLYSAFQAVSYTHLTLPTIYSV